MTILTLAARLAHKLAFSVFDRLADGLTVGHLGLTDVGLHTEFALHAIHDDLKVQFTHAGDQGLARLFVGLDSERRVFLRKTLQGNTHFFLVDLGLGLNSLGNHRLREHHALKHNNGRRITQSFAGGHVFHADTGRNVTGADLADFFTVVGVHLHDTADTLFELIS